MKILMVLTSHDQLGDTGMAGKFLTEGGKVHMASAPEAFERLPF